MRFFDELFTELTGIERYSYHSPPANIQLLSEHYNDIFGTTTGSVVVAADYSEDLAQLLHRAKYIGDARTLDWAVPTLNEAMEYIIELDRATSRESGSIEPPTQFVLSYVPIWLNRLIERGFNQSHFLARAISKKQGILLERVAFLPWSTGHQSRRTKDDRASTGGAKFYTNTRLNGRDKTLVIIDDVISTGTTMSRLISALKSQNWEHIIVLALARNTQSSESLRGEWYIYENGLVR
jgi:predicted amidophosphoribosyltransferase